MACFLLANKTRVLAFLEKAQKAFQKAIDLDPENVQYKANLNDVEKLYSKVRNL